MTTSTRRRWRLVLGVTVLLVLAATLVLRLYSARRLERAVERFEREAGSLDLATYEPRKVTPRRDNAAFWLRVGAEALVYDGDSAALIDRRIAAMGEPWPPADEAAMLAYLADNEPARSLLDRAAGLERSSFEIEYRRGPEAELPDFLALIRVARVLAVESDLRLQRGETSTAMAALHLLERLAAAQRTESVLIALLTGIVTERLYWDRLEAALWEVRDPAQLRAVARDVEHLDAASVQYRKPFAADVAASFPVILRGTGRWMDDLPPAKSLRWVRVARPLLRAVGADRLLAARLIDVGRRAASSLDHPQASVTPGRFEREVLAIGSGATAAAVVRLLAPNYYDAIQREQWNRSSRALGRLAIDLALARAGHGAYPPRDAVELPVSAATGESAIYAIGEDGGVELAFPKAQESWELERSANPRPGTITSTPFNFHWRLPP